MLSNLMAMLSWRGANRKRGAVGELEEASSATKKTNFSTSFTWRIKGFSKLRHAVFSDSFEAGIGPWRLRVDPSGCGDVKGTHLSVFLELQDAMWAPGSVKYKLTVVNQADASKSLSKGGSSGDVALKLPCGAEICVSSHILQRALPFFHMAFEDIDGSDPIPVDGSLSTWNHILSHLDPQYDPPALTLGSVLTLLPLAHKYDFDKLLKQLLTFMWKWSGALSHIPEVNQRTKFADIIPWLALAERLQLDELAELCLSRLRTMNRGQLQMAITKAAVQVGSDTSEKLLLSLYGKRVMHVEVKELSEGLRKKLLAITSLLPN
ncbi:hypothetical protein FOA52_001854 [Chlamydomonas sp. UWO 241]|nr:hypothetical protein FOA52_001854 [Chlamydomonas sp. UWO 241]